MGRQKGVSKKVRVTTAVSLGGHCTLGKTATWVYGLQAIKNDKETRREQLAGSLLGEYFLLRFASSLTPNCQVLTQEVSRLSTTYMKRLEQALWRLIALQKLMTWGGSLMKGNKSIQELWTTTQPLCMCWEIWQAASKVLLLWQLAHVLIWYLHYRWKWRWYKDMRTWHQRVTRSTANWSFILDNLVQAYLRWKYDKLTTLSANEESPYNFTIPTVDIYTLATSSLIHCGENSLLPSITLMEHGYLGNSQEKGQYSWGTPRRGSCIQVGEWR